MSRRLRVTVLIVSGIVAVFAMVGLMGCVSGPSTTPSSSRQTTQQATTSSAQPLTNSSVGTSSSLASTTTSSARSSTPVVSRWPAGNAAVVVQAWAGFQVIDAKGVVFSATDPAATNPAPGGTASSETPMSLAVSANGTYIAYRFGGGDLVVRVLATGEAVDHMPVGPKDQIQAVSDDGRFVALVASDAIPGVLYSFPGPVETVAIADLTLKERTVPSAVAHIVTERPHGYGSVGHLDWLPNNDLLVSVNGAAPDPQAYLYNPGNEAVTAIPALGGAIMVSPHGEVLAYSKKLTRFSDPSGGNSDVPLPVVWRDGVTEPIVPAIASPGPSAAISPDGNTVVMTVKQREPAPRGWQAFQEMNGEWRPVTKVWPYPDGVDWVAPQVVSEDGGTAWGLAMQGSIEYMVSLDTVTGSWSEWFTGKDKLTTILSIVPTIASADEEQSDVRVGVMIPAYVLYRGWVYTGTGLTVEVGSNIPTDLSLIGSGPAAGDQTGVPVPDSHYSIYAIEGTSQDRAIAVKFQGTSSNGPVWVWLKYERKK